MFEGNKLNVSSSPHLHCGESTRTIMLDVIIALIPAAVMSVLLFGSRTLLIMSVSVVSCVLFEYITRKILKRSNSIGDFSAVITGILLAFNLPSNIPLWTIIIGAFVAIVIVKQFFGGIGQNFVNPAVVGRITLMVSFPQYMSVKLWPDPKLISSAADATTSASPLALISDGTIKSLAETFSRNADVPKYSIVDMFLGFRPGCLGETCIAALLIGGIYLVFRKVISPIIPLVFMGTVVGITWICGQNPLYNLMSGGLVLGAIFMATDYTTCPINKKGKIIYALGCGLITAVIRLFGSMPEGVSVAIVLMNILVPHIERITTPKPFGYVKQKKSKDGEAA